MVQIYERPQRQPGFGEQMGRGLGGLLGSALKGGVEGHIEKKQKEREDLSRREADESILKNYGINLSGIRDADERKTIISESLKGNRKIQEQQAKELKEVESKKRESQEYLDTISEIEELLPYAGAPIGKAFWAHFPWSKAAEKREEMDVLAFQLERYARAAHTKGALSTKVYNSLLSKLPDSTLSEAKNRGRLKGWKEAFSRGEVKKEPEKQERAPLESFLE